MSAQKLIRGKVLTFDVFKFELGSFKHEKAVRVKQKPNGKFAVRGALGISPKVSAHRMVFFRNVSPETENVKRYIKEVERVYSKYCRVS